MTNFKERLNPTTKVEYSTKIVPEVIISDRALNKMYIYTDEVSDEVGWLGTAYREGKIIVIGDVFLLKQQVHGATTEITPEGLQEFATEILAQEDGVELWNNMKMWGHSHVNMGVFASGQDNKQMEEFSKIGHDFFVRLICNKKGEMGIDVYDYEKGLEFHNVPWRKEVTTVTSPFQERINQLQSEIEALKKEQEETEKAIMETVREPIKAEIAEKVSKLGYGVGKSYVAGNGAKVYPYTGGGVNANHPSVRPLYKTSVLTDVIDGVKFTVYDYFTQKELQQIATYCQTYEDFLDEMFEDGMYETLSMADLNKVWNEVTKLSTYTGWWNEGHGYY